MQKTVYQPPELRDDNNKVIRGGPYGRYTAFCTSNNEGVLDYINNNLEWLYDNSLQKSEFNSKVFAPVLVQKSDNLDKENANNFINSAFDGFRAFADYNSSAYSPDGLSGFWSYMIFSTNGRNYPNYNVAMAFNTSKNLFYVGGGYDKNWKQVETVSEYNAKYIRYASGLQITFESINSGAVNVINGYSFPAPFIALPVVSVDSNSNIAVHATGLTNTGCNIQLPSNSTARTVHIIAIGRWK